jgi:hypothetical protein
LWYLIVNTGEQRLLFINKDNFWIMKIKDSNSKVTRTIHLS